MKDHLSLNASLYANVTPAGAFYATSSRERNPSRDLLCSILKEGAETPISDETLMAWTNSENLDSALSLLYRLQRLEFIYGANSSHEVRMSDLEIRLPDILKNLSDTGRALLADNNGLYYATSGYHHESAEEIAALAGDMVRLSERHALLLKNNLNISQNAWAISDPAGRSELAFFPLFFGENTFVLVVGGTPQLQSEAFVELVEILHRRYGE